MTAVGTDGHGTIGKRVADAVGRQPDTSAAGVSTRTPPRTVGP
jgi:glyceraldehyde-3-phosphate dehydrogenase (NAD(P))